MKKVKFMYAIFATFVLAIVTMGSTYAYLTTTTNSIENSVTTGSTSYSISMNITPIYSGFSFIPMNDTDVMKALRNKCKDKYDRGACTAYNINVFGYSEELSHISGKMDIETTNMENISYMVLEESEEIDENECIEIEEKNYCISKETTPMGEGKNLSIGDAYNVYGLTEKNLLLVLWLSNLNERQNEKDIGNYNATITVFAGNGGEITGTIANAVKIDQEPVEPGNNTP